MARLNLVVAVDLDPGRPDMNVNLARSCRRWCNHNPASLQPGSKVGSITLRMGKVGKRINVQWDPPGTNPRLSAMGQEVKRQTEAGKRQSQKQARPDQARRPRGEKKCSSQERLTKAPRTMPRLAWPDVGRMREEEAWFLKGKLGRIESGVALCVTELETREGPEGSRGGKSCCCNTGLEATTYWLTDRSTDRPAG